MPCEVAVQLLIMNTEECKRLRLLSHLRMCHEKGNPYSIVNTIGGFPFCFPETVHFIRSHSFISILFLCQIQAYSHSTVFLLYLSAQLTVTQNSLDI